MTINIEASKGGGLILRQLKEMEKYKWIESEKAGRDLGDRALFEWIERYEQQFLEHALSDAKQSQVVIQS